MIAHCKKTISLLLAAVLLLAPLELVFAQQGDRAAEPAMQTAGCMMFQPAADHHLKNMNDQAGQCDGHGSGMCKHCVYCSPALSSSITVEITLPSVVPQETFVASGYSIDLPAEIRPPRQL
jgi:hypothetical protein